MHAHTPTRTLRTVVAVLASFLACATPTRGQVATITGTAADTSGARLADARVVLESTAGDVVAEARTAEDGTFTLAGSTPGPYRVRVDAPGFRTFVSELLEPGAVVAASLAIDARADITVLATRSRVATKTDTEVRLLPQSVTLVPQQLLADQQADDLSEVVRNVGGAVLAGNNVYGVRGVVSNSDGNFRKNGVETWTATPLLNQNVERVEVLKGPASVLYGRLDPGGIINVVTKQPQASPFRSAELRGGTFGYGEGRTDLTGAANRSRTVLYRFNAAYERRASHRDEVTSSGTLIAPVVTVGLGTRGRWTIESEFQTDRATNDPGLASPQASFASLDTMPIGNFLGEPDAEAALVQRTVISTIEFFLPGGWVARGVGAGARYDRDADTVGLARLDAAGRSIGRSALRREQDYRYVSGEAVLLGEFSTGRLRHKLSIGVNVQQTTSEEVQSRGTLASIDIFSPVHTGFATALTTSASTDQTVDLSGLFVQHQTSLGSQWHLSAGGRLTEFDQRDTNRIARTGRQFTAREFSPHVGVVFAPRRWLSLYGSYSEAFKPTLNTDRAGRPFDPQFGMQWETGIKADLAGGRLSTTVAVFRLNRNNQLSFVLNPDTGLFDTQQGGLHRSEGVEFDVQGALWANWHVTASYAWLDAVVVSDPAYLPGRRLGAAPVHSGSVWSTYRFGTRAGLGGGVFFQDEFKAFTSADLFVPGFVTADLAGWYQLTPALQLQVNVKNLANERYYLTGAGSNIATPAAPRSAQAALRIRF